MNTILTLPGNIDKELIKLYISHVMSERDDNMPRKEDLKKSRLYFSELEDALIHYSNPELKGSLHTVTVRSDQEGNPQVEFISETRFPALDDIQDHLKRLHFVAERLDNLPVEFWVSNNYYLGGKAPENFPHMPMQVFLWGEENRPTRKMELQKHFQQYGWDVKGAFTRNAYGCGLSLRNFSWSDSNNPDSYRDDAEKCFRMVDAYIKLREYFIETGLPENIEEF